MSISRSYKPQKVWFGTYILRPGISPLRHAVTFEGDFAERRAKRFLGVIPTTERTGPVSFVVSEVIWALITRVGHAIAYVEALHLFESLSQAAVRTGSFLEANGAVFRLEEHDIYLRIMLEVHSQCDLEALISVWNCETGISPGTFEFYVSDSLRLDLYRDETRQLLEAGHSAVDFHLSPQSRYVVSFSAEDDGRRLTVFAIDEQRIAQAIDTVRDVFDSNDIVLQGR